MKEYLVSLDILTPLISPRQFTNRFGVAASLFQTRKLKKDILWSLESHLGGKATLADHVKAIFKKIPVIVLEGKRFPTSAYINVGVLYDTYTCSVGVPADCVSLLEKHGLGMEFSCYPTDFTNEGKSEKRARSQS
jgi:hypothetical protein